MLNTRLATKTFNSLHGFRSQCKTTSLSVHKNAAASWQCSICLMLFISLLPSSTAFNSKRGIVCSLRGATSDYAQSRWAVHVLPVRERMYAAAPYARLDASQKICTWSSDVDVVPTHLGILIWSMFFTSAQNSRHSV